MPRLPTAPLLTLASAALLLASAARAADTDVPLAFEGGVRVGGTAPLGRIAGGENLSRSASFAVPLELDLGLRIDSAVVGLFVSWGVVGIPGDANGCDRSGLSCSASQLRVGVQAQWLFQTASGPNPWVGVGTGYEWLRYGLSSGNDSASLTARGVEFVHAEVGLDWRIGSGLRAGPYLGLSVGQYDTVALSLAGESGTSSDFDKGVHLWLGGGFRIALDAPGR